MKISVPSPHLDQLTSFFFTIFNVVIENRNYLLLYVTVKKHETQKSRSPSHQKKKVVSFSIPDSVQTCFYLYYKRLFENKIYIKKKKKKQIIELQNSFPFSPISDSLSLSLSLCDHQVLPKLHLSVSLFSFFGLRNKRIIGKRISLRFCQDGWPAC